MITNICFFWLIKWTYIIAKHNGMVPIKVLSYYTSILLSVVSSFPKPWRITNILLSYYGICPLFDLDAKSGGGCTWIIHIMVISRREYSLVITLVCLPSHAVHNIKQTMGGKLLKSLWINCFSHFECWTFGFYYRRGAR